MTTLYLVRHGETILNKEKVYYGRTDCPLTPMGQTQARDLKTTLIDYSFDVIISSPLKRCVQTTEIITGISEQDILLDYNLVELDFGLWEGLHHKEISQRYPKEWAHWVDNWEEIPPPKGESFMTMYNRVKKALGGILSTYQDKNILIISHKGCLQLISSILLAGNHEMFWNFTFEQGKYSVFEVNGGHCTIKKLNCG